MSTCWKWQSGSPLEAAVMVYVSDSTELFYLSRNAMEQSGIIGHDFPKIGADTHVSIDLTTDSLNHPKSPCGCAIRSKHPTRPESLSFSPLPENTEKMKQWLINRYAASTFNKCLHQSLPMMSGPPIKINIDKDAPPTAVHTPATIPIHWRQEVEDQLTRDVNLGVIEKVPPNTPSTWYHRAIWTRKPDGSPRRVVDFQSLNRHCIRDTRHTIPPFQQAQTIPLSTYRTVTDA